MKPVFGQPLPRRAQVNPCVLAFGPGPEGTTCQRCRHIYRVWYGNTYRKCDLREHTNGQGSDHRLSWPACSRYEEGEQRDYFAPH